MYCCLHPYSSNNPSVTCFYTNIQQSGYFFPRQLVLIHRYQQFTILLYCPSAFRYYGSITILFLVHFTSTQITIQTHAHFSIHNSSLCSTRHRIIGLKKVYSLKFEWKHFASTFAALIHYCCK